MKDGGRLSREEYARLLDDNDPELTGYLGAAAGEVAVARFGKAIYKRGLIDVS